MLDHPAHALPALVLGLLVSSLLALAGLVLLFVFVGWRRLADRSPGGAREADFAKLPYGAAIGVGGLAAFVLA